MHYISSSPDVSIVGLWRYYLLCDSCCEGFESSIKCLMYAKSHRRPDRTTLMMWWCSYQQQRQPLLEPQFVPSPRLIPIAAAELCRYFWTAIAPCLCVWKIAAAARVAYALALPRWKPEINQRATSYCLAEYLHCIRVCVTIARTLLQLTLHARLDLSNH